MMRLAWVILMLAATAAGTVHLRLQQNRVRTDMNNLEAQRLDVRRRLWDQQLRLGELTAPQHIRALSDGWPFQMVGPGELSPDGPSQSDARGQPMTPGLLSGR